jgi:hypothetical protein
MSSATVISLNELDPLVSLLQTALCMKWTTPCDVAYQLHFRKLLRAFGYLDSYVGFDWSPLKQFSESMYHCAPKALHLLNGQAGQNTGNQRLSVRDVFRSVNLGGMSVRQIERGLPDWVFGPGDIYSTVNFFRVLRARPSQCTYMVSASKKITLVTIKSDGMPIGMYLQWDTVKEGAFGCVTSIGRLSLDQLLPLRNMNSDDVHTFLQENPLATEAVEYLVERADGGFSSNLASHFVSKGGGSEVVGRREKHARMLLKACEHCCERGITEGKEISEIIPSSEGDFTCDVNCTVCIDAQEVCVNCALLGFINWKPSLRVCSFCRKAGLVCHMLRPVAHILDQASDQASWIRSTQTAKNTFYTAFGDPGHAALGMWSASRLWWIGMPGGNVNARLLYIAYRDEATGRKLRSIKGTSLATPFVVSKIASDLSLAIKESVDAALI